MYPQPNKKAKHRATRASIVGMTDIDLISTKEACRILNKDKSTLGRWIKAGKLTPAFKGDGPNGIMLFQRTDIEALA